MAHYATTISSPWPAEKAFAYMADLRNFENWDPGVKHSKLVLGTGPGLQAAYDVKVTGAELRYETLEFDAPTRTVVEANSKLIRSYDVIGVAPTATGCHVTYDATLELKGLLGIGDPLLGIAFKRIGDKAALGMAEALEGEKLT